MERLKDIWSRDNAWWQAAGGDRCRQNGSRIQLHHTRIGIWMQSGQWHHFCRSQQGLEVHDNKYGDVSGGPSVRYWDDKSYSKIYGAKTERVCDQELLWRSWRESSPQRKWRFVSYHSGDTTCINTYWQSIDSFVYVWQRENGNLVEKLPGHSRTVNCVAWNPKDSHVFASAGDDRLIRM